MERVRTFVAGLATRYTGLSIRVVAFDQDSHVIYDGPAPGFSDTYTSALIDRRADGVSDLGRALVNVRTGTRLVVITDGVITAGIEGAALADAVRKLAPPRVDVILAGGIRDDHVAKSLVRVGSRPGDIFDLDAELAPIEDGLGESVQIDVPVEVVGARWFYPHTIASARAGAQVMIYAQMPATPTQITATVGNAQRAIELRPGTQALVERAAARAQIADLEDQLAAATTASAMGALRNQIETRSVAARVVSSQATMLVLDDDAQYERYGIDRKALADILVVGPNGLEQQHRTYVASTERTHRNPALSREDAIAAARSQGVLGTLGSYGTVGHGSGYGAGFGMGGGSVSVSGHSAAVPAITINAPAVVSGSLDRTVIRRYIQRNIQKITYCYERELMAHPRLHGTVEAHFVIGSTGRVESATATGVDDRVSACVADVVRQIEFPAAERVIVNYPFTFRSANTPPDPPDPIQQAIGVPANGSVPAPTASSPDLVPTATVNPDPTVPPQASAPTTATTADSVQLATQPITASARVPVPAATAPAPELGDMPRFNPATSALRGQLADIMRSIARHDVGRALSLAHAWRDAHPTDVLAIVGLGEAAEAAGDPTTAARVYGSLIDLYPTRADYRRFVGERLERLGPDALALAIDTYRRSVEDRPDQITGHRLLTYALLRAHDYGGAFAAIVAGLDQKTPDDRFAGAAQVFARDASMIATSYLAHGGDRDQIMKTLAKRGLEPFTQRSTRVMLYWETDANDVDLHVRDSLGNHSWYAHKPLESGGTLYADITTGFGPECFEIVGTPSAGPYDIGVHYYRQGPMGYGMGLVQIETFDGKDFVFDDRPYVIMQDEAYVSLRAVGWRDH